MVKASVVFYWKSKTISTGSYFDYQWFRFRTRLLSTTLNKKNELEDAILDIIINITDSDILKDEVKSHRRKGELPIELHEAVEENEIDIEYGDIMSLLIVVRLFFLTCSWRIGAHVAAFEGAGLVLDQRKRYCRLMFAWAGHQDLGYQRQNGSQHFGTRHQSMFSLPP